MNPEILNYCWWRKLKKKKENVNALPVWRLLWCTKWKLFRCSGFLKSVVFFYFKMKVTHDSKQLLLSWAIASGTRRMKGKVVADGNFASHTRQHDGLQMIWNQVVNQLVVFIQTSWLRFALVRKMFYVFSQAVLSLWAMQNVVHLVLIIL